MFNNRLQILLLLSATVILLGLLLGPAPAYAAVFEVPCEEDASAALSAAVQAANDTPGHDIIRLEAGCTYTFSTAQSSNAYGPNALPIITEALTIEGNGANLLRHYQADSFRFIYTAPYVPLVIKDLSLTAGRAAVEDQLTHGGAIYAHGSLSLENVYFLNNSATGNGGAVYTTNPETGATVLLVITGTTFEENWATGGGGALYTWAFLTVNDSEFYSNWSDEGHGGALNVFNRSAVIQNSLFVGNYAYDGVGGAIRTQLSTLTIVGTQFRDNYAVAAGAVSFESDIISPTSRSLIISGAHFLRNEAAARGGALSLTGANLSLQQSTFIRNTAPQGANALSLWPYRDGQARIANNLFVEDPADPGSQTIYIRHGGLQTGTPGVQDFLHNTLVKIDDNSSTAIYVHETAGTVNVVDNIVAGYRKALDVEENATEVYSGFNLYNPSIGGGTGPEEGPINPYGGGHNLLADPLFVDVAGGDYRLQRGSPAVDSGINVQVVTDMLGVSRPQGTGWDRGAYEYVNHAPVAAADAYSAVQDTNLSVPSPGVLANDSDANGDALTTSLYSGAAHGGVVMNPNGSFTYIPDSGFVGVDSFSYRAYDGQDYSNVATVTITVEAANNSPVAADDEYATLEDTPLLIAAPGVLDNDEDADGDTLTVSLESAPSHGAVTLNANGSFNYTPNSGYVGEDSFSYRAYDGEDHSNVATVTITIIAVNVNLPPVAVGDSYTTSQDTTLNVASPGVLANDSDADGDTLTAVHASQPSHGSVTLNANGSFSYTPNNGFAGEDSFSYRAYDGEDYSNVATVTITVEPANNPPVAADDDYAALEDTPLLIAAPGVLDNDDDADGDTLTAVLESTPSHGTVTLNANGSFQYVPGSGYIGEDSFTYTAFDGEASSNVATVTITVVAADTNLPPVAVGDSYTTEQDTTLNVSSPGVLANDSDADGDGLIAVPYSSPAHGNLVMYEGGGFTYTPDSGFVGEDSFTYRAYDGQEHSNIATVTITVEAVNSAPVAADDAYATLENVPLAIGAPGVLDNDEDADGDALTAVLASQPAHGSVTLNANGSFSYVPDGGYSGEDAFSYRAYDGEDHSNVATVTITVVAANVNLPPVAIGDTYATGQDTTLSVAAPGVLGNDSDVDGDSLSAILQSGPDHGSLALNTDGSFTYIPDYGFAGADSFRYRAYDGEAYSNVATVSITVQAENNPPVAADDNYATLEETPLLIAAPGVLDNDEDVDGDTLTAVLESSPSHGTITLDANGSFSYVPDNGYTGEDSFTYRAFDGTDSSNVAIVTITVAGGDTNLPPVAVGDTYTVGQDTTLNVAAPGVLANDSDVQGDTLAAVLQAGPAYGTLALNADGSFTYVPDSGFAGEDSFTYTAFDGELSSNVATVRITVEPQAFAYHVFLPGLYGGSE
jgi:VCBS repeat-containing protein/predicted outer membrane repeat protein